MKKLSSPALFVSILLFLAILSTHAAGFSVSFDKDSNGINSQNQTIKAIFNGTAQFTPGISGQALLLDRKELRFPAPGNIDLTHGAVSFWIKPENWGDKNVNFLPIFTIDSSDRGSGWKILFYYHRDNAGAIWDLRVLTPNRKEIICQTPVKDSLKLNDWNHITISWTNQEIELSVNGSAPIRQTYGLPIKLVGHRRDHIVFMPEKFWRVPSQWRTAIDEIEVFAKPLTAADTKTLYLRYRGSMATSAKATMPPLKNKIKLDGTVQHDEWADATKVPVMTEANSKKLYPAYPAWAYIKADKDNFYIAFEIFGKEPPIATGEKDQYNQNVFAGDEAEFVIFTNGRNFRQYFISPNGSWSCLDYEKRWQPQSALRHAARIFDGGWSAELIIPRTEISAVDKKTVKCNFGIHRKSARDIADSLDRWISWSVNPIEKSVEFQKNHGVLTFADHPVRIESIGELAKGNMTFAGNDNTAMTIKNLFNETSFVLKSGEVKEINAPGLYSVEITSPLLFWSTIAEKQELFSFDFECDANTETISFSTRILDRPDLVDAIKAGNLNIRASIIDQSGKSVASAEKKASSLNDILPVKFNDLENGKHILRVEFSGMNVPVVIEKIFDVPDRSFLGNTLGISSKIPHPWSKVEYNTADEVTTAFHKYIFDGGIFPVKAWSAGENVLRSSSGLLIENNGKPVKFSPEGNVAVSRDSFRLIRSGVLKSDSGECKIRWKSEIDIDGLIRYSLIFAPQNGKKVKISQMKAIFEIPAQAALAAVMPDFSNDYLKKQIASSTLFAGATSDRSGFSVFTHDNTNYVFRNGEKPFNIRKKSNNDAEITVNFITIPVEFDSPVEISVSVMATPGKPPRRDWRVIHSEGWMVYPGQNWAIRGWTSEKHKMGYWRGYLLTSPFNQPAAKADVEMHLKHGISDVTYTCNNLIPGNNPIHDYFAKAWARPVHGEITRISQTKEIDGTPYFFGVPVCPNHPGFRDYICYYVAQNMDKTGFKGVYFDFGGLAQTDTSFNGKEIKNVLSLNRKIDRENLFGVRELYRRLRNIIKERHADGMLYIHCWRAFHPGIISFVDTVNPGEEFMHSFPRDNDVYIKDKDFSPPELWRTSYNSQSLGVAVQFLAMLYWIPEMKTYFKMKFADSFQPRLKHCRSMLTMCLLHDVQISGGGYAAIDGLWPLWDQLQPEKATFHGYFEQKQITADQGIKVSYYSWQNSTRKLIVLGNFSGSAVETTLKFNHAAPAELKELWPGKNSWKPNQKISVGPYGFRLLVIE